MHIDDNHSNVIEEVGGLDDRPPGGYEMAPNPDMTVYPQGVMVGGSVNNSVYSGYPMAPVQPQMGMYPTMAPQGFAPGMQGGAVVTQTYNPTYV